MFMFKQWFTSEEYNQEQAILSQLPGLDMVQQAQLDMKLHDKAIGDQTFGSQGQQLAADKNWKQRFIDIIQGREKNPEIIQQTIDNIESDLESHRGRLSNKKTGSSAWHEAWIAVYMQWLQKLHQTLGAFNGT